MRNWNVFVYMSKFYWRDSERDRQRGQKIWTRVEEGHIASHSHYATIFFSAIWPLFNVISFVFRLFQDRRIIDPIVEKNLKDKNKKWIRIRKMDKIWRYHYLFFHCSKRKKKSILFFLIHKRIQISTISFIGCLW